MADLFVNSVIMAFKINLFLFKYQNIVLGRFFLTLRTTFGI
jgi:hypothetical protein